MKEDSIFDKKFEEEQKLLQEAKKKRQGEYQENTTTIVNDLIAKKQNTPASPDVAGSIKNNYDQFYQKNIDPAITGITNVTDNTISQVNKNLEKSGQNQLPQISIAPTPEAVPVAPPIVIDNNDKAQIPAMFLEQEKAKQLLQQQTSNNQQAPATNNASQLPIIPLP